MDNTTKKFTKLITDYLNKDNGLLLIYENEARIMIQRQPDYEPDYLATILSEVIRRDVEEYMPEMKDVYMNLLMSALDEVDFEVVATPFIANAIEDRREDMEIEQTNESLKEGLKWAG